jgi:hypothetical protein
MPKVKLSTVARMQARSAEIRGRAVAAALPRITLMLHAG